jgi:hypothetical protein
MHYIPMLYEICLFSPFPLVCLFPCNKQIVLDLCSFTGLFQTNLIKIKILIEAVLALSLHLQ